MTTMSPRFVTLVRAHLQYLPPGDALAPTASLRDLGLDSLQSVELLIAVEDLFNFALPDDALTAQTFATPGNLWNAVCRYAPSAEVSR